MANIKVLSKKNISEFISIKRMFGSPVEKNYFEGIDYD